MRAIYAGRERPRLVTVLAAYFDDSRGEGIHAIAGYLGLLDVWDGPFADEWNAMLASAPHEIEEFKASDCRHGCGEFLDVSRGGAWTKAERTALYISAVDVVTNPAYPHLFGVGGVVRVPRFEGDTTETEAQREYTALIDALLKVGSAVVSLATQGFGPADTIQFTCDYQKEIAGRLVDLWGEVVDAFQPLYAGKLSQLQFADSKEIPAIQAADLLAYETRKDLKNKLDSRPQSRALERLITERFGIGFYSDPFITMRRWEEAAKLANPAEYVPDALPLLFASPGFESVMPWEWEAAPSPVPLRWPWETDG